MTEPSIAPPDLPRRAAVRDTVIAALMLSATAHAGAVYWAVASGAAHDEALSVGGTVAIEVLLVQGPSEPAAAEAPGAEEAHASRVPTDAGPIADRVVTGDVAAASPFTPRESTAPSAVQHAPEPPDAAPPDERPTEAAAPPPPPPKPDAPEPPADVAAHVARTGAALPAAAANAADDTPAERIGEKDEPASSGGAEGTQAAAPLAGNPAPDYPYAARQRGQHGRVLLRVEVAPSGDAGAIAIERSSGYETLDRAASEAVRRWRFRPAHRNGAPIAATVQVPVRFDLQ